MNASVEIPRVNYSFLFAFEDSFDHAYTHDWMYHNWKYSFVYAAVYLVTIFSGRAYMARRPRFELRGALFLWSVSLALFSIVGTLRFLPELFAVLRDFGFHHSCCNPSFFEHNKVSGFWTWMFALSKVLELGDTLFIVLRKQTLIFLHWYHHITVLSYVWYSCADYTASGRWFIAMNYTVHSFMYSYYALKALRVRVPRPVSMLITSGQLAQMVVGIYVNVYVYRTKARGAYCNVTDENVTVSLLMYFSYFLLFLKFFVDAYMQKKPGAVAPAKKVA